MKITFVPTTHYDERCAEISIVVLHATATNSLQETLDIFLHKEEGGRVSSHYVIDRDGKIYQLVADEKRAWHAGVSSWGDVKSDVNSHSIGIEFQCPALGDRSFKKFTQRQIKSGVRLCRLLTQKYNIQSQNIVAHSDIAPGRKFDPGVGFPMQEFKKLVYAVK